MVWSPSSLLRVSVKPFGLNVLRVSPSPGQRDRETSTVVSLSSYQGSKSEFKSPEEKVCLKKFEQSKKES